MSIRYDPASERGPHTAPFAEWPKQRTSILASDVLREVLTCQYDCRANSMSVVTARSSASRTAKQNPSSSSARTPAALRGLHCTEGSTRRVSQR